MTQLEYETHVHILTAIDSDLGNVTRRIQILLFFDFHILSAGGPLYMSPAPEHNFCCSLFQAMRQLETDHRFKQAERTRAEEIGLVSGSGF